MNYWHNLVQLMTRLYVILIHQVMNCDPLLMSIHLDEVVVGPGQPVVHDIGGDNLDEEEGELLGRFFRRVAQLLLFLEFRTVVTTLEDCKAHFIWVSIHSCFDCATT